MQFCWVIMIMYWAMYAYEVTPKTWSISEFTSSQRQPPNSISHSQRMYVRGTGAQGERDYLLQEVFPNGLEHRSTSHVGKTHHHSFQTQDQSTAFQNLNGDNKLYSSQDQSQYQGIYGINPNIQYGRHTRQVQPPTTDVWDSNQTPLQEFQYSSSTEMKNQGASLDSDVVVTQPLDFVVQSKGVHMENDYESRQGHASAQNSAGDIMVASFSAILAPFNFQMQHQSIVYQNPSTYNTFQTGMHQSQVMFSHRPNSKNSQLATVVKDPNKNSFQEFTTSTFESGKLHSISQQRYSNSSLADSDHVRPLPDRHPVAVRSQQQNDRISCPSNVRGVFPYPFANTKYIKCIEGKMLIKSCDLKHLYSISRGLCDIPLGVRSFDVAIAGGNQDFKDEEFKDVESLGCPKGQSGIFLYPFSAACYSSCDIGVLQVKTCLQGEAFNINSRKCEQLRELGSNDSVRGIETSLVPIINDHTLGVTCDGATSGQNFSYPNDRRWYVTCDKGKIEVKACGDNKIFDIEESECVEI